MLRQFAALALLFSTVASASEPDLFGFGARSGGLAGTGVADAEGYDASYTNPAGVVGPTRRRLTIGYLGARYDLALDGAHRPVDRTDGILIGADLPLPFGGLLQDRLAIGLAFFYPVGNITSAKAPYPDVPRLALLDDRTQTVSVLVTAGLKLHRRVSIGGGVLALAALVGTIAIRPDASGRITTAAEEQLVTDYAPVVGVRVVATDWLKLGLVLRGESKSSYDINVINSLGPRLPIQLPTLHIAGVAQFDPLQLALEGAARWRWLALIAGVTWKHWSDFPAPVDNATPGAPPQAPSRYHDTAVPRLALETTHARGPVTLHARAGYFYEMSPAPRDQAVLVDADRHVLTAGFGLEWHGRFSGQLDLFGQVHLLASSPHASGEVAAFGATVGVDL